MSRPVTVTVTITGAVYGTYTQMVESGTLEPNGEVIVSFPNVNIGALGQYFLSVQLDYAGDQYIMNNVLNNDAMVADLPVGLGMR